MCYSWSVNDGEFYPSLHEVMIRVIPRFPGSQEASKWWKTAICCIMACHPPPKRISVNFNWQTWTFLINIFLYLKANCLTVSDFLFLYSAIRIICWYSSPSCKSKQLTLLWQSSTDLYSQWTCYKILVFYSYFSFLNSKKAPKDYSQDSRPFCQGHWAI